MLYCFIFPGINEWNRSKCMSIENYRLWEIACKLATTVQVFAIVGDFLSIFLITMDRFMYINFPLRYEIHVTKRRIFVVLCVTLILATPFAAIKVWLPDRCVCWMVLYLLSTYLSEIVCCICFLLFTALSVKIIYSKNKNAFQ